MSAGFFQAAEVDAKVGLSKYTGCGGCGLYRTCKTPKMPAQGLGQKGILIIGESPCASEDRGERGEGTQMLAKALLRLGISLENDCKRIHAVNCCIPHRKDPGPTANEIAMCHPRVWQEINDFKPKLILLLGGDAVQSFLLNRWEESVGGIGRWRGWCIPDRDVQAWVCPAFHPSYVGRLRKDAPVNEVIWNADIKRAIKHLDKPFPSFVDDRSLVRIEPSNAELQALFESILDWRPFIDIDYETTGLKPQHPDHRVVTCSISTDEDNAYAFSMDRLDDKLFSMFQQILENPSIPKLAHGSKFEDSWSKVALGITVQGWEWCSMLGAHVLDNRPSITGLKFQVYVKLGVVNYNSRVEQYLKSDDSSLGKNSFNTIYQAPRPELLLYNGLDTLYSWRISDIQRQAMGLMRMNEVPF